MQLFGGAEDLRTCISSQLPRMNWTRPLIFQQTLANFGPTSVVQITLTTAKTKVCLHKLTSPVLIITLRFANQLKICTQKHARAA